MTQYRLGDDAPEVPTTAYVAAEAVLIGKVSLGERASIWSGAVLRGDNEPIRIGEASNVQEGAVLHADPGFPLEVGAKVTIGHQAMLHGCTIGEGTLIGIQAAILARTFEEVDGYDEMIVLKDIRLESYCEHHMVPIIGKAHVAYLPSHRVVGISKLARLVDAYAKRLQIQEKMTVQIADTLQEVLQSKGVAVVIEAATSA